MKLKAKKARRKYKNDLAYIRAVYRNNKSTIDAAFPPEDFLGQKPFTSFRRYVEDQLYKHDPTTMKILKTKSGKPIKSSTVNKTIESIARSEKFTSKFERLTTNAFTGIKKFPSAYKRFRELTKMHGRYAKIDSSKMEWNYDINGYIYDNRLVIIYKNSPAKVEVYTLEEYATMLRR